MRNVRILSFLALIVSALSFAALTYPESDWNWRPAELPMPGPGLEVGTPFKIVTAGRFELEIEVPQPSASEAPTYVDCNLQLTVKRDDERPMIVHITKLRQVSSYEFGKTDQYSAEPPLTLAAGRYELRLANKGSAQPFGDRGATVSLTRFEHPTEAVVRGALLRGIGWFALVVGVIGAAFSVRKG